MFHSIIFACFEALPEILFLFLFIFVLDLNVVSTRNFSLLRRSWSILILNRNFCFPIRHALLGKFCRCLKIKHLKIRFQSEWNIKYSTVLQITRKRPTLRIEAIHHEYFIERLIFSKRESALRSRQVFDTNRKIQLWQRFRFYRWNNW